MTTPDELDAIYREGISTDLFGAARPERRPVAAIVGGQPGSGKTRAGVRVRALAHPQQLTPILGDDLRAYHPEYAALMRTDPLAMPDATAPAVGRWVEAAIDEAIANRYPVLVEGTFRRAEVTVDTAERFRAHGFDVHLVALAVPDWQSRIGILDRYVGDHAAYRQARWTSLEAHDRSYAAVPGTIEAAIRVDVADRVTIIDRQGRTLLDSSRPDVDAVLDALNEGRRRLPFSGEREAHAERLAGNLIYLQQTNQLDARTTPLVDAVRRDSEIIAALDARALADTDRSTSPRLRPPTQAMITPPSPGRIRDREAGHDR